LGLLCQIKFFFVEGKVEKELASVKGMKREIDELVLEKDFMPVLNLKFGWLKIIKEKLHFETLHHSHLYQACYLF